MDKKEVFPLLDGYRGFAALFILLFHTRIPLFAPLWTGVPFFFALSGFLITRILLQSRTSSNYFRLFYFKRALRIFPVYYVALGASIAWALIIHVRIGEWPWYALYLQSLVIPSHITNSFANGLMVHTWSLSVEEIFYFFWPLVIFFFNVRIIVRIAWCLVIFSIIYKTMVMTFFYHRLYNAEAATLLTPFGSLDSLMAGVLTAVYGGGGGHRVANGSYRALACISSAAVVLLCMASYMVPGHLHHLSSILKVLLSMAVAAFSAVGIRYLTANKPGVVSAALFGNRWAIKLGRISYGLYVYHYIVYHFVGYVLNRYGVEADPWLLAPVEISISFGVAALSWRWMEQPLLKLKTGLTYTPRPSLEPTAALHTG